MHPTQGTPETGLDQCTQWLVELAEPKGLRVDWKRRPEHGNRDHYWWFSTGEPPKLAFSIELSLIESCQPDESKRELLRGRFLAHWRSWRDANER